jgi:hypothetical protein
MKKVLLLMVAVLMISSVAMADHFGIYADPTGASCALATGFTTTSTVIEKFSLGSTGCRLSVDNLPTGGSFFAFSTAWTPVGDIHSDLSLGYGTCQTGSIVLGSFVAIFGPSTLHVLPAQGFTNIIFTDCTFGQHNATGGTAYVGGTGPCGEVATEPSTWGQVKALYR